MKKREPETKEVQYQQMVFLCDRGKHEVKGIYLWRGAWLCPAHLRDAKRAAGATGANLYVISCLGEQFRPEEARFAKKIERITSPGPEPQPSQATLQRRAARAARRTFEHAISTAKDAARFLPKPDDTWWAIDSLANRLRKSVGKPLADEDWDE